MTAIDSFPALLIYARQADASSSYALADAAVLPFPDACFDVAVAYSSLQVVPDMPRTVAVVARVLVRGGRLCSCVSHPITDVGHFLSDEPDAPFALRQDYFANRRVDDTVERDGLEMTFRGWTRSLADYAAALEHAGPHIEAIREPQPEGAPAR